MLSFEKTLTM